MNNVVKYTYYIYIYRDIDIDITDMYNFKISKRSSYPTHIPAVLKKTCSLSDTTALRLQGITLFNQ